jgi:hypothetical protein
MLTKNVKNEYHVALLCRLQLMVALKVTPHMQNNTLFCFMHFVPQPKPAAAASSNCVHLLCLSLAFK